MGKAYKKSIIVEFNGLPGSGKTTICNEILQKSKLFDYSLCTSFTRRFYDKFLKTVWLDCNCVDFYTACREYLNSYPSKENMKRRNDLLLMHFFRLYSNVIKHSSLKVLIVDQGIIQALLSVPHNTLIQDESPIIKIVNFLESKNIYFYRINCVSNLEVSQERVLNRPTNLSRLDHMDMEELKDALSTQSMNISTIREVFDKNCFYKELAINIDTKSDIDKNVNYIIDRISQFL